MKKENETDEGGISISRRESALEGKGDSKGAAVLYRVRLGGNTRIKRASC